jgi:hypothetical protein
LTGDVWKIWASSFLAVLRASATLAGLFFVSLSVNQSRILELGPLPNATSKCRRSSWHWCRRNGRRRYGGKILFVALLRAPTLFDLNVCRAVQEISRSWR